VHLAREPQSHDLILDPGGDLPERFSSALPPVFGVLLGPAGTGTVEGILRGGLGDNLSRLVHRDGASAARAHVQP
jgi:hypothetical protein